MNLTFTHLKLLIQLHDSPLIVAYLSGRKILAIQELEKAELVNQISDRVFIATKGLDVIAHLELQFNEFVQS